MTEHPVVKYPAPVLFKGTEEVDQIGERERILIKDMIDTMYLERGVGLAANQIGVSKRIFVVSVDGVRGKEIICINPRIIRRKGSVSVEEGCLSIPGYFDEVKRYQEVTLRAKNLEGKIEEIKARGLLARVFQHETDHLDGILFVNRFSFFKRRSVFRQLKSEIQER